MYWCLKIHVAAYCPLKIQWKDNVMLMINQQLFTIYVERQMTIFYFIQKRPELNFKPTLIKTFIVFIFFGPLGSWVVCNLHMKIEFNSCTRGRPWCGIFHYYWTTSIKPKLLYSPFLRLIVSQYSNDIVFVLSTVPRSVWSVLGFPGLHEHVLHRSVHSRVCT